MVVEKRIADYIEKNGVKQKFISEVTGIEPGKLSNILSGNRACSSDECEKICIALKVDPNTFLHVPEIRQNVVRKIE